MKNYFDNSAKSLKYKQILLDSVFTMSIQFCKFCDKNLLKSDFHISSRTKCKSCCRETRKQAKITPKYGPKLPKGNTPRRYKCHPTENRKKWRSLYEKTRISNDIQYKLKKRLRNRLSDALRKNVKMGSAIKDLGCSLEFLKQHLESLFQPGMTWDNYGNKPGNWSIDHIYPLSRVDLTNREELLKVVHYTNLRPLWHIDNLKKGNKT